MSRGDFYDEKLSDVNITAVKLSGDLLSSKIYFRTINPEVAKEATRALERVKPRLRTMLAESIKKRRVPQLEFIYDDSVDYANRIFKLLEKVKKEPNEN